jgi:hypothetical protein
MKVLMWIIFIVWMACAYVFDNHHDSANSQCCIIVANIWLVGGLLYKQKEG